MLYSYERGGGDVGMLVRTELENMLASIAGTAANNRESDLVATRRSTCLKTAFRPVWVIASYNLLTNYMSKLIAEMEIPASDRTTLESVITTVLLRDMGLTMEGFWRASHETVPARNWHMSQRTLVRLKICCPVYRTTSGVLT